MLGRWKLRAAAVAAIALGGVASAAHASNVTFSTFGTFTPTSGTLDGATVTETDGSVGNSGDITLTNGSQFAEIQFSGVTTDLVTAPISGISFGTFFVSSTDPTLLQSFNGTTFTLNVNQTVPGPGGSGSTPGTVIGTVNTTGLGQTTALTITFASPTVTIPGTPYGVNYIIDNGLSPLPTNVVTMVVSNGMNPLPSTLGGDLTFTPLPATASTGLALLGGLGVLGGVAALRRRRQMA